ncbi:zinc metallo protein-like proteinase [Myriangium duriaei CBS 260.36]|uniref:Zinc metallo protein-like proteinase n=1 Tax=Myriangium duriaei CBS 260.36 TaxID=1168546 RepID=A0A9P4MLK7_9PEZI|nr:zinc metallo protein-like proteinase [Myriangium duriaei CBS 260.36]
MPSFLSDLRRRSRNSIKNESPNPNNDSSSNSGGSNDGSTEVPTKQSSFSNLVSHFRSPSDSQNTFSQNGSTSSITRTPPLGPTSRPPIQSNQNSRYSIVGSPAMNGSPRAVQHTSPLAPLVNSISEGSWVHQKVLLISGTLADSQQPLDGQLVVCHHQDTFPATQWPVAESHFKALVHLQPGPNRLRLDFLPSRRGSQNNIPHSSWININYLPLASAPPLQLVILVAKDSPLTYDAVPERIRTEGNGLDTAIKKYRTAGYLWQAFTGEQMNRHGFGRRCFRFDEEWQQGTSHSRDGSAGTFRNEAKVHVVRVDKTVSEIQDLEFAQQHEPGHAKSDLFGIAIDACKQYFNFKDNDKQYVAAMYLDSHWDKSVGTIRGHAALGGGAGGMGMAIFGSHALQSYPTHIDEVVPAFTDCTRTDLDYVANDANESGSSWEAANIGIGAHLHEVGHLFGCPHQEHGVMLRDYVRLNRTFTAREPYSTRTKSPGLKLCQTTDECGWHRLDILRFRFHPCFVLPTDQTSTAEDSVQAWGVDGNAALITSATGIGWVEIKQEGDDLVHAWVEYFDPLAGPSSAPRQITLTEAELKERLKDYDKNKKIEINIFSCGQANHEIKDFGQLVSKTSRTKLPDGRSGFRGAKLGFSQMDGSKPDQVIWESAYIQTKLLVNVRVFAGFALDGIEFMYEDGTSQLFGKRGGSPNDFQLDTRRGETIMGFFVRAGAWVDGVQILTTSGRKSDFFGNAQGGTGTTMIPPRGYNVVGIHGSCADWTDGFGLIISR